VTIIVRESTRYILPSMSNLVCETKIELIGNCSTWGGDHATAESALACLRGSKSCVHCRRFFNGILICEETLEYNVPPSRKQAE
jgi:hypothetical protein